MAAPVEKAERAQVVILDYQDLVDRKDLSAEIERGFGYEGIGLLAVKNIPGFVEARKRLLPLGSKFAALPTEIKDKSVHKASNYSFGWSHGKEILQPGKFDTYKGSYYNNPQYDVPTTDAEMVKQYPGVCSPNIWPKEDLPELEEAFKGLGLLVIGVGKLVAEQCDKYVKSKVPSYPEGTIARTISGSLGCKARLLHYFPIKEDDTPRSRDSWCGWHNDFDSLTGLCPAMYMRDDGVFAEEVDCPDSEAGLYVRTRQGKEVKVNIPRDYLAFQIGESSQIQTGGVLRATPHAVQAVAWPESRDIARNTFAVFMQPNTTDMLDIPEGIPLENAAVGLYQPGMNFAKFATACLNNTYRE